MKIRGKENVSSLELLTAPKEWSILWKMRRHFVLGLNSVVCMLTILSATSFSLNTGARRFLIRQELPKGCMSDVPQCHKFTNTNTTLTGTKPINIMKPEGSKRLTICQVINA
jgi:hypothetical protein